MQSGKALQFEGKAGGYFVVFLVTWIMSYIPFLGWAFAFNYVANWIVENTTVSGKKLSYDAKYGETLVFILVNVLLLIVTLGIYVFWFVPKMYRYVMDHVSYAGEASGPVAAAPTPAATPVEQTSKSDNAPENTSAAPKPPLVQ